ncbi:hypothetical protein [Chryseobacterium daeguense]|uniref:hypothetical protein n=1 Tax=Chryseobacterium daeguense TaxID=412438 RepID=UPI00041AA89D|nr:hypothetical protein [Chryseobacterium daeguense]
MGFYSSFSEQDLIESYKNQIDYQEKISDELLEEITQRGSLKDFQDKIENQRKILDERNRIIREIHQHYMNKRSKEECFSLLDSNILSQKEIKILVHTKYYQIKYNIDNLKVDLNIIVRSFAGIFIASSISTLIMSSLLIAVNELIVFHLFLLVPAYIINYFIIRLFTKKTRENLTVFIATFLATLLNFAYIIMFVFM